MVANPTLHAAEAARVMRAGGIIAYPTEAVYGLGCDPSNEAAVRRILELKQRSADAGLILIGERPEHFQPYVAELGEDQWQVAHSSWPGPTTWLFPRGAQVPDWLAGKHPAIALRLTAHPESRALCVAFGGAVVSTSANPSGQPPARSAEQVSRYFGESIDGILEGRLGGRETPSEIKDLLSGQVIRSG